MGQDNDMTVLVHNIQNTEPERGVTVTAYNYQHQALASARPMTRAGTAGSLLGTSVLPDRLTGTQRSYLRVDNGSALSLSSFDVSGEVVQKGIKALSMVSGAYGVRVIRCIWVLC